MAYKYKFNPITGKLDMVGSGSSEFDPNGIYPNLTSGGLIARESDSIIDYRTSFIFRSAGGNESISNGAAKIIQIFGNVVNGVPFCASSFKAVGFNAFNPDNVLDKVIKEDGSIEDSDEHKVAYIHVIAGQVGSRRNNGYIISSKESSSLLVNRVAFVAENPTEAVSATVLSPVSIDQTRMAYIPPTAGWLLVDCYNAQLADMCVHLAWSYNPQNWTAHTESILELPVVHEWGMGKAGSVMDEVDFLNQTITIRTNRTLLTDLSWTEARIAGDVAYSSADLTEAIGAIESTTENSILVNDTEYIRSSAHDTATAYAWSNDGVIVYTESATPAVPTYSYATTGVQGDIKASTGNVSAYGLSSEYQLVVSATGALTLFTGTHRINPSEDLAGIYVYYELAAEIIQPETLDTLYKVDDFGTEEFIGTSVPPTYATFFYLPNLYDGIRQAIVSDDNMRSYTVPFGTSSVMGQDVNVEAPIVITKIVAYNVATLRITTGSYIQTLIPLTDGIATVEIPVALNAIVTWEITRINNNQNASIGVRYEY